MADIHIYGLAKSNTSILQSSKYADMTLRCGSEEFKLHRAIICPRSRFFAAACDGQFQEARTCTIVLTEDDLPTVRRMLTYLYTLAYDDEGDAASAQHYMVNVSNAATSQALTTQLSAEALLRHAKMMNNVAVHAIAQKYDIGGLKELATEKFKKLLWLKRPSHGLPEIIDAVFETTSVTDPGLRNIAVRYCVRYRTEIVADDGLCSIIRCHGDLGLDVLREVDKYANKNGQEKEFLQQKLVTLRDELAQMILKASEIGMYVKKGTYVKKEPSVTALVRKLKKAYANVGV